MSRHQRTRRAALAATGAIVLAALGAGVAQAHVHPTPLEKAAPGVVYIEARANVEVALVEHHAVGDPSGVHIAIIQSAWNPVLASASGFFVDPNGAIVTTGAIRTPDLERAKIYAVNEAFHARYGNAAPLPADPFTRHHIPTAGSHDDERLQACYPPYRTNDAGGCVVSATLDLRVYPYVTSQQRYGNLTAEVLPGTNPDVAVLRVRGANGIPTVPLATSTAKDKALSVLGFLAVPTTFDSLVKVDQHLQVAGGGALRSTGLDAQDVTFARQLRADLPRGLAGGPILAEDGLAMGLLPRPVAAGSAPPPLASLTEIQQALKAAGVTPARGVVDASYETAMHLYKNGSYQASIPFFQTSMDNLLTASEKTGVGHFVILSIVGVDLVPELDYYRAKALQEEILKAGPIPYSIVRATQFMEFMDATLAMTSDGGVVRLPRTPIQPIAAADVARTVAEVAASSPLGGTVNIAGPDVYPLDELGRLTLAARPDGRTVTTDDTAGMFAVVHGAALTAPSNARIAPTRYTDWLAAPRT